MSASEFLAMPDRAGRATTPWDEIAARYLSPRCPIHWADHIACGPFCEGRIIREPAPALLFDPTSETWSRS